MTLKELSQLYYLNREIEADQERLKNLRAKTSACNSFKGESMPKNPNCENTLERYVAEIVDLEMIISAKITQCLHERNRLERYIADIPDSLIRQIFTLRFINGLNWVQVAHSIGNNTEQSVKMMCYRYIKNAKN